MFGLFNRKRKFRSLPQTLLTDSAGAADDSFGYSVSLSGDGNTAIVGAQADDVFLNTNQGSATIYTRSGALWTQQQTITLSDGATGDRFGWSVALSSDGNTAIIGAPYDNIGANADQGSATIFTRSSSTWTEQIKITHPSGAANSNFGFGVAISDDGLRVAVGRVTQVGAQLPSVRIYFYNGSSWVFEQELTTPTDNDSSSNTNFGTSVAFDNTANTLIVGANAWDGGTGAGNDNTGAAIVYTRSGTTWSLQATLKPNPLTMISNGAFGQSVALSGDGNLALIGAPNENVDANPEQGRATVHTRTGSTWTTEATLLNDSRDYVYFGNSVALSNDGNTAIIGAYDDNNPAVGAFAGSALIFTRLNGIWTRQIKVVSSSNSGIGTSGNFGISVSLSKDGKTALIGDNTVTMGATTGQGSATIIYRR